MVFVGRPSVGVPDTVGVRETNSGVVHVDISVWYLTGSPVVYALDVLLALNG